MRGKFITLEGIDGAGKTTHLAWLAGFLRERGMTLTVTREPGGTPMGERLREMMLDRAQELRPETEALLMFAARREHMDSGRFSARRFHTLRRAGRCRAGAQPSRTDP